jgi:hypothetical protein
LCYLTALIQGYEDHEKAIVLSDINFKTSVGFNISTIIVFTVLTIIYSIWW